jgi:hypothetical protein
LISGGFLPSLPALICASRNAVSLSGAGTRYPANPVLACPSSLNCAVHRESSCSLSDLGDCAIEILGLLFLKNLLEFFDSAFHQIVICLFLVRTPYYRLDSIFSASTPDYTTVEKVGLSDKNSILVLQARQTATRLSLLQLPLLPSIW